ncbi:MAG TPA: NYN domain-containing protein [Vicinamibacterales bacterium]|nr:NYN domain-containing protein [Vicinamibacterales bacterium]
MPDTRLKIAVFIDFDNIEIGVKSTLGVQFDIGIVLEALRERGDVVSKVAYGDWTRAGDYSRSLTQHATKLVQRNLTPGGDKNGADINLALDALEMAFTHTHINAYVIVGGDSDFISLVEKLKQYDKQIFVVGGRSFTSLVMQRNCHEFIAYENLVGSRRPSDRGRQSGPVAAQTSIEQAVPLVRRALKVLTDREVSPQLGLLKSTLLQLDSTFSERTYGAGSFRDFAQKLAAAGHVVLREAGRNVLVELPETGNGAEEARVVQPQPSMHASQRRPEEKDAQSDFAASNGGRSEPRTADGIREVRRLFQSAQNPPRWPMYIRQAKQYLRNVDMSFDERKYGFASLVDLMRACQREGLFRIERDRQGVMRLFPGNIMQPDAADDDNRGNVAEPVAASPAASEWSPEEMPAEPDVVDGDVVQEMNTPAQVVDVEAQVAGFAAVEEAGNAPAPARKRGGRRGKGQPPAEARQPDGTELQEQAADRRGARKDAKAPRTRKAPSKPRAPRRTS